ncbi:FeoC-like transcriptional regulator [Fluoribacter dumoffii]|uniref:FeoC like transcriptional regulator n=1 Tax=Fluoribacter dumoffii TaxID=463 RepID=A0A377G653_9GAMM|nr:FeoC-like transcriptional regulator [Fluoribacter dumoffii]KTC92492.1 FeoC like transcriptional regulator [Fluoribacter dumoffii NY 23]MCW8417428.1 FeoC-like transcriptional regulator [Fluoribacter dumoffii]MCW8454731.1 FeoC-like transcriptional regulator [Fluoribacter dumoffii]MCW8461192.1 FeoC-like transcriptional regulator [Fluoribacter dumoffii]MCW8484633.1 FeoC-like transcriptional regulator [Fluoribacter dumoffii]
MLLQIRDYIGRAGVVSTQQLTREFRLDLPALQPMLDLWIGKGVIGKCQGRTNCQSTCFKCRSDAPEYYQYLL